MKGQIAYGTLAGTGSAINVPLGFSPSIIFIINQTDPGFFIWTADMADAEMLKLTDAPALTFPTSNGISLYAGSDTPGSQAAKGFTIGADTDMNGSSDVLTYIAIGEQD
ncbi:MAG: hypothetical protein KDK24_10035 [Pseudooceanicola sp.]|nr:hypothetical protein [Pseudooceanicola sp.]